MAAGVGPSSDGPGRMFCVIAGGGTAGHLIPGLAVADALVARGHAAADCHLVVSERSIDAELVGREGFGHTALPGHGLQRRLTLRNLVAIWELSRAQVAAFRLLRGLRPRVVLVVGGFASVACTFAAVVLRVPLVVAEQNARAGLANRVAGRFARACAVSFAGTDLPRAVVTGNPVRSGVLAVDREADRPGARDALGIPRDCTMILAFSGSLGSRRINDAVLGLARRWSDRSDLAIRHVTGSRDFDVMAGAADQMGSGALTYQVVRYEDRMELALAAADIAVCRAGGNTVAELALVGLPAVLVPLPIAPRDHQSANARCLVEAGAVVHLPDAELDETRLARELAVVIDDPVRLGEMSAAAARLGRPDAAERVADLLEAHAR